MQKSNIGKSKISNPAFTIIELLVVVVVIGILSSITFISYSMIAKKANLTSLKNDLEDAAVKVEKYKSSNGAYPTSDGVFNSGVNPENNAGATYSYNYDSIGGGYCLASTKNNVSYHITSENKTSTSGDCPSFGWKQVSASGSHTCAIASNNAAYCWGSNYYGQLGNNSTSPSSSPVRVNASLVSTFKTISAGTGYTCAIALNDMAYCWGGNNFGQLGDNSNNQSLVPVKVNVDSLSVPTFKSISANTNHTCAITTGGAAYCWGDNGYSGRLGNNSTDPSLVPVQVSTSLVSTFKSISAGTFHTCAIATSGAAYCWGYNNSGQLGDNSTSDRSTPYLVHQALVSTFTSISAGINHTCAIATSGVAYCWGGGGDGEFGNGLTNNSSVPVLVNSPSSLTFKSITAGANHTCAIMSDNTAYCWGYNGDSQLGDNSTQRRLIPTQVNTSLVSTFKSISAVSGSHTCAIANDSMAYCWGWNDDGQLGDGTSDINRPVPTLVVDPS